MTGDLTQIHSGEFTQAQSLGGTVLKSSRNERFKTPEGRKNAYVHLCRKNIDALIVIGGDGSMFGLNCFCNEYSVKGIGIPKTIDNDLTGTDFSIGFDTAVNTAMRAIDNLRDTADAHNRIFLAEVMGRNAGYISMYAGLAVGANAILMPETQTDLDHLREKLKTLGNKPQRSFIAVVAEGDEAGGAFNIAAKLSKEFPLLEFHCCVLGIYSEADHQQLQIVF